jgi:hypothetical protein
MTNPRHIRYDAKPNVKEAKLITVVVKDIILV